MFWLKSKERSQNSPDQSKLPRRQYALQETDDDRYRCEQASLYPVVMMSLPLSERFAPAQSDQMSVTVEN